VWDCCRERNVIHFTLKVRSMQKIKVSTSGFTLHFFFVSFRFSASVAEEMFSVPPFIIAWLVCVSVSFFTQRRGNGRIRILFEYTFEYTCRRFFRTIENAYSLTRAAIQLWKWVIAGTPSFPSWMWKKVSRSGSNSKIKCNSSINEFFKNCQSVSLYYVTQ